MWFNVKTQQVCFFELYFFFQLYCRLAKRLIGALLPAAGLECCSRLADEQTYSLSVISVLIRMIPNVILCFPTCITDINYLFSTSYLLQSISTCLTCLRFFTVSPLSIQMVAYFTMLITKNNKAKKLVWCVCRL